MRIRPCKSCHGQRLKPSSLAVTIADKNIYQITDMSIVKLKKFLDELELTDRQKFIGADILKEIIFHYQELQVRFQEERHRE